MFLFFSLCFFCILTKTGPNDMFHIVWAIVSFSLLLSMFFTYTNHLTGSNDILKLQRYLWEATTKRTGPNDMKHIIWAISKCFFFYLSSSTNHFTDRSTITTMNSHLRKATTPSATTNTTCDDANSHTNAG